MKLYLRRVCFFLLPIALACVALELMLRRIPNDYSHKRNYLDKNSRQIEVLFLGSSHAFYGIDPLFLETRAFNAAYVSQTLHYDFEILKKYEGRWDRFRYVVLAVDYFSLYNNLHESVESWRVKNYNIYWGINDSYRIADHLELFANKPSVSVDRLTGYYSGHKSAITTSELGRGPKRSSLSNEAFLTAGAAAAKRHTYNLEHFDENVAVLEEIIDFAKANDAKVLLYTSPADPTYYRNLERRQQTRNSSVLHEMDSVNEHVQYVNFLENPAFTRDDFWDPDHLNENGARKLTIMIGNLIRSPNSTP
ncbi:MAG TPA: hypothetical protein VK508_11315 [Cyclobacteriaceae bacterium]|nr:hypothetical protein [Cyclobacteriaceae bacterium]